MESWTLELFMPGQHLPNKRALKSEPCHKPEHCRIRPQQLSSKRFLLESRPKGPRPTAHGQTQPKHRPTSKCCKRGNVGRFGNESEFGHGHQGSSLVNQIQVNAHPQRAFTQWYRTAEASSDQHNQAGRPTTPQHATRCSPKGTTPRAKKESYADLPRPQLRRKDRCLILLANRTFPEKDVFSSGHLRASPFLWCLEKGKPRDLKPAILGGRKVCWAQVPGLAKAQGPRPGPKPGGRSPDPRAAAPARCAASKRRCPRRGESTWGPTAGEERPRWGGFAWKSSRKYEKAVGNTERKVGNMENSRKYGK